MKAFLDASVLVPVVTDQLATHPLAFECFTSLLKLEEAVVCTSAHALAECYATLTALPLRRRISGPEAVRLIEANFIRRLKVISLTQGDYHKALRLVAGLGRISGQIYDALHLAAATKDCFAMNQHEPEFSEFSNPTMDCRQMIVSLMRFCVPSLFQVLLGACCLAGLAGPCSAAETLLAYVGAASKPPTEEAARLYEEKTGVRVELVFGGSGFVLSQMKLARQGDLYFPGSSDFMEKAKRDGAVFADSEKIIVYLVSAINVRKGNPKQLRTLKDLTRPGLRVAIADPERVCVGTYAVEIVEKNLTAEEKAAFRANLVNHTESCEKTATAVSLKMVDAVIGWSVFEHWDPQRIETVALPKEQVQRIGYIPIAISKFTKQRAAAQAFIAFLTGPEGQAVYARHRYFTTAAAAAAWLGAEKPVGGEYQLPADWTTR
jgi:molybdate transport system substrate-binding protein